MTLISGPGKGGEKNGLYRENCLGDGRRERRPEDIAQACLFLSDEKNSFITGENIVIDGGMTKKMIYSE